MGWLIKALVLAVAVGSLSLVIEKTTPAISLLTEIAACVMLLLLAATLLDPVLDFAARMGQAMQVSGIYAKPLLKCCAIALVTKTGASLCRDAKQSGAASALELTGAAGAVWSSLPLLEALLAMLERLL